MTQIDVVVLDMAGTTIADDGVVEAAFNQAMTATGIGPGSHGYDSALAYVRATMGQSKIEVFRQLLPREVLAQQANEAFEKAYGQHVQDGAVTAIDGARPTIELLQSQGIRVALTTGFAATTRDLILEAVGWADLADLVLSPSDAGRGRPHPDLNLTALMRLGGRSVTDLLVAGDTGSDMLAATRAGAGTRVGVLTGAGNKEELQENGATDVVDDISALPVLLAFT